MNEFDIRDGVLYKYLGAHGTVVIPDTVQAIHEKAFRGNTTVTRIEIPNTVVTIEWGAFSFCENLEQLIIPPLVYFISVSAIEGCTKLQSIIIEGSKYYYAEDNRIFSTMDTNKVISTDILK